MTSNELKAYADTIKEGVHQTIKYRRDDGSLVTAILSVTVERPAPALPTLPEAPKEFKAWKIAESPSSVHFKAESPSKITWAECTTAQRELGFNPMGYGSSVPVIQEYTNGWSAHWNCFASCE